MGKVFDCCFCLGKDWFRYRVGAMCIGHICIHITAVIHQLCEKQFLPKAELIANSSQITAPMLKCGMYRRKNTVPLFMHKKQLLMVFSLKFTYKDF